MRHGWSLVQSDWQKLREQLAGHTWRRAFLESDYVRSVPKTSGVYLICASTKTVPIDGRIMQLLYNAIYAGQALNLNKRFRDHVRGYGNVIAAKMIFRNLDFWYCTLERENLSDIEQRLLTVFGPSANVKNVIYQIGDPEPAGRILGA